MIHLSKIMLIFAPSVEKDWRHRGKRLGFDPLENLENSSCTGIKFEGYSSCSCIYHARSSWGSVYIYPCRCELNFILTYIDIPETLG